MAIRAPGGAKNSYSGDLFRWSKNGKWVALPAQSAIRFLF